MWQVVDEINGQKRENATYLKGYPIPVGMQATNELEDVVEHSEIILMVVPTPFVASTVGENICQRSASGISAKFSKVGTGSCGVEHCVLVQARLPTRLKRAKS